MKQETKPGLNEQRITRADIEAEIIGESFFTAADGVRGATPGGLRTYVPSSALSAVTFCVLQMRNGTIETGRSICAPGGDFRAEVGRKQAKDNAIKKLFPQVQYMKRSELAAQGGAQ